MAKQFVWNPDSNQTYDGSYGSQTVTSSSGASFSKNLATFTADCPQATVTFKQLALADQSGTIFWNGPNVDEISTISILSGDVVFDFGNNLFSLAVSSYGQDNTPGTPGLIVSGGSLAVKNLYRFEVNCNVQLSGGGKLYVTDVSDFLYLSEIDGLLLIDDGTLLVNSAFSCELGFTVVLDGSITITSPNLVISNVLESTGSTIDLSCDYFYMGRGAIVGNELNHSLRRGSKTSIIANKTLSIAASRITLTDDAYLSMVGIDPKVFFDRAKFKFDFDTKQSEGECSATLVFEPADSNMQSNIRDNGCITINEIPVPRFEFDKNFTSIITTNPKTKNSVLTIQKIPQ